MNVKSIYRAFLNISTKLFGVKAIKQFDAYVRFHRKINYKTPTSLSDKLCYLELNVEDPLKVRCTDKYAVRDYVASKGLEDILVPLCHKVCSDVSDIHLDILPSKFAMKATHGCGMNLICDGKDPITGEQILSVAKKFLQNNYDRACLEPHYQKIPHRVMFEQYLEAADDLIDYKFHCFHGVPEFVLVCSNRRHGLKLNTYTTNWEPLDVVVGKHKHNHNTPCPSSLKKMLEICKVLSEDFDFVRVDLYELDQKIYFGELTFSPATGILPYFSEEFLKEKGALLHIDSL